MSMFKASILFLFILWSGVAAPTQSHGSSLLRGALHCLAVKDTDWLAVQKSQAQSIRVSYAIDTASHRTENTTYVVAYANRSRTRGKVFDLTYQQKGHTVVFDVQNNGSFARSGSTIDFFYPPLGGVWTQAHLLGAIKQADQRVEVLFDVKTLSAPLSGVTCRSFVDNK
jgi:hypothetical protein